MSTVSQLRRARRSRRLGDAEWFDLAYHVYLAGIFGGGAIIIASDYVGDDPLPPETVSDVLRNGPAVLGLLVAAALLSGLRSGASGGPVSIEPADVRHLLLAPVPRGAVLRVPFFQRLRTVVAGGALAGGVAGLLTAQRMPGTAPAWVLSGSSFGACIGAVTVAAAGIAHELRLPRWAAPILGGAAVGWQLAAVIADDLHGPFDGLGDLALWGYHQHASDFIGVGVALAAAAAATALAGRLRPEHLARRGDLVSQLRFAVTMQDLRTVVLLRRQLRQEHLQKQSWLPVRPSAGGPGGAAIRRGVAGIGHLPAGRLVRILVLTATAGAAAGLGARGTTSALIAAGILLFVAGLDLVEPLSQEVDHPDLTDSLPRAEGWLHERLLVAPAIAAIPAAMVGAAACTAVHPDAAAAAFTLAIPIVWVGMSGAVLSILRDNTPQADASSITPPEVAGFRDVARLIWPVAMSSIGMLCVLGMRARPDAGTAARCLVGMGLFLILVRWWIVHRLRLRQRWNDLVAGAQP